MTTRKRETKPANGGGREPSGITGSEASKGIARPPKKPKEAAPDPKLPKDKKGLIQEISILHSSLDRHNKDLKDALSELESSRDKFRHLYNTTPVGYLTLDKDASVIAINASAVTMLAAPQHTLTGREFTSFIKPQSRDMFRLAVEKTLKTGEKHSCELEMVTSKDTIFSVYLEIAGLPGPGEATETLRIIMVDITQRRRVEEALRESEERYRLVFENTSDGIYLVDSDFKVITISPNMGKMLGYSAEELAGKRLTDLELLTPGSMQLAIANLARVLNGETVASAEYEFIAKDGTHRYQDISGSPLIKNGKVVAAVCVARDMTERKLAEQRLQKSEEKYRTLVENANEGIAVAQDGIFKFFNSKFETLSGYSADEISRLKFQDLIFPEDRDFVINRHLKRLKGEQFEGIYACRYIHKSGEIRWAEINAALMEWEGKPATLNFYTDITERKKVEEALQKSEEKYRTVVENAGEAITIIKEDGSVGYFNNRFLALSGYEAGEILSRRGLEFIFPEDRKPLFDRYRRQLKGEKFEDILTCRFIRKSGEIRWLEINFTLIEWQGKPATLNFQTDITGRKKAEEALQKSEDQYRTLVENANEGITVVQDGTFKFFNARFLAMIGYDTDEIRCQNFTDFLFPEDRATVVGRHRRRLKGEQLEGVYAFRYKHKSGEIKWAEISAALITWEGKPATLNFFTDVTERKKAEEALQQERDWEKKLLDIAGVIILVLDTGGKVVLANAKACQLLGYRAEDMVGKSWTETFLPESARNMVDAVISKLTTGDVEPVEYVENPVLTSSGEERIIAWHNTAIKDKDGRISGTLSSGEDITERKRAERNLEKSNKALKKTLDDAVNTMAKIVEIRDPYTSGHQKRVAQLSAEIASEMGLDEQMKERLRMAAIIHDIGKIYIPSEILSKPGKLGEIEFGMIKTHPDHGYNIVKSMDLPCSIAQAIQQHHERMDGSGYPAGLMGKDIVQEARILAVADVVEAMASHRPYRPALGIKIAIEEILKNRGKLYDPDVVDTCVRLFMEKGFKFEE
jgi:PAS domain S-box-containing protein/putative nucleotidyltransferase with HDIG domain